MSKIEILNYRAYQNNTLQAFFDVKIIQTSMIISGCTLHERDPDRWIGYPCKEYKDKDGNKKWTKTVCFEDKDMHDRFQASVIDAIDEQIK